MDNFEYTFINAKHDEDFFTDLLNTTFQDDYGYSLHDCNDHYSGYHSTLVCKHNAMIIGGISVYISDPQRTGKLPMERRGIDLKKYVDLRNRRYAEICRAGVLRVFRKYHIYSELMKRCVTFCARIGCQAGFWVAKKHHSQFYESELKQMGMNVKTLAIINHTQFCKGKEVEFEYYLSCCTFEVSH
jgi:hypothetical protein